ncbi:gluconate 5-dehydrogenase [Verrucomicrobiota bacterium]|nr:gluconate 5-dehydrogenase [Verrucomicrobiota bacterium]
MSDKKLNGRVAVITGASKGLGKAMSLSLAAEGAKIVMIARNAGPLEEAATEVRALGVEAITITADVADETQVERLRGEVVARFGSVHILINNAGMNLRKPLADFTLAEWRLVLDTNLTSAFLMSRAMIPHLVSGGGGRIINLTSMMSHISLPGRVPYSSSKAGLLGFTKALALEMAPRRITVNGISPGPCATEINTPILNNPEVSRQFTERIPLGRWGKVEEIGALAAHLCSDAAEFITGTDIVIDGGWTAQ